MTNEEALKMTIRECNYFEELSRDANGKGCRDKGECKDCYANFVIEALEKQVPKKPNTAEGYHYYCFKCPTCNEYVRIYQDNGYCLSCGQNLDWSDYE